MNAIYTVAFYGAPHWRWQCPVKNSAGVSNTGCSRIRIGGIFHLWAGDAAPEEARPMTIAQIAARPTFRRSQNLAVRALDQFALAKQAIREGHSKFAGPGLAAAQRLATSARVMLRLEDRYDRGDDK